MASGITRMQQDKSLGRRRDRHIHLPGGQGASSYHGEQEQYEQCAQADSLDADDSVEQNTGAREGVEGNLGKSKLGKSKVKSQIEEVKTPAFHFFNLTFAF